MTVSVESGVAGPFVPNSATTAFDFDFKIMTAGEVQVIRLVAGLPAIVSPSGYSVTLAGDGEGGTVTFTAAPATGSGSLYIVSHPTFDQTTTLSNSGFLPTSLNAVLDRIAVRQLALKGVTDRALSVPFGEPGLMLPSIANRSSKLLGFGASGAGSQLVAYDISVSVLETLAGSVGDIALLADNIVPINTVADMVDDAGSVMSVALLAGHYANDSTNVAVPGQGDSTARGAKYWSLVAQSARDSAAGYAASTGSDAGAVAASRTYIDGVKSAVDAKASAVTTDAAAAHADRLAADASAARIDLGVLDAAVASTSADRTAVTLAAATVASDKATTHTDRLAADASALAASGYVASAVALAGIVKVYDTKALGTADVGTRTVGTYVLVQADESRNGFRAVYKVTTGPALTFSGYLPGAKEIYVSNVKSPNGTYAYSASDANDGLTPASPKLTLAGARAIATAYCTVYQAGGSKWYAEAVDWGALTGLKFKQYGQGPEPVWTCRASLAGDTWAQPDAVTYPHVWKVTKALPSFSPYQATPILSSGSSIWGPAMYYEDRGQHKRVEDCGLARRFTGATRADCLAAVEANLGSFYTNVTGSSTVNPQTNGEAGSSIDMYVSLPDGSNPNGKEVTFVDQRFVATIPADCEITDLRCECTGSKDFMNVTYALNSTPGRMTNLTMSEASIHGGVWTGVSFDRCAFSAAYHGQSRISQGGGIHNFRGTGQQGQSRGFRVRSCKVTGFGIAFYSHGSGVYPSDPSGEGYWDHAFADYEDCVVQSCNSIVDINNPLYGVRLTGVRAYDVDSFGSTGGNPVLKNCTIIMSDNYADFVFKDFGQYVTLNNSLIWTPIARGLIGGSWNGATQPQYFTITLNDSVIGGAKFSDPSLAVRAKVNLVLTGTTQPTSGKVRGSYFGILGNTGLGFTSWIVGTITANAPSIIETDLMTPEALIAQYPGVAAGVITSIGKQTAQRTVQAGDLVYQPNMASRNTTYSGTPDTGSAGAPGSTATLTFNAGVSLTLTGGQIRVVDAYGAGLHYIGRVLDKKTGTSVSVTPSPTGAFSLKSFGYAAFNKVLFGPTTQGPVAALWHDGLQVRVPTGQGEWDSVGNYVRISNVPWSPGKTYVRKIIARTGDILTFDTAIPLVYDWGTGGYVALDGTGVGSLLPTCTLSYGFPFVRFSNAQDYQVVFHDGAGTSPLVFHNTSFNPGWFQPTLTTTQNIATYIDITGAPILAATTAPPIDMPNGTISQGFSLAEGDVLTVHTLIRIDDYRMDSNMAASASRSGDLRLVHGSVYADRLGYQSRRTN